MADHPVPECPAWLAKYPRALERWNALWPVLERTRLNPLMQGDYVSQYCMAYSDMRDALEKMERGKLVAEKRTVGVGDKAKTTIEKLSISPYQSVYDNAVNKMERLGRMIGLDPEKPLDRAYDMDDFAEFLGVDDGDGDADDAGEHDGSNATGTGDAGSPDTGATGDAGSQATVPARAAGASDVLDGRTPG